MARTIRRKHYVPGWVTEKAFYFIDPKTGVECRGGYIQLEGAERAKQLRWWHEDKSCWWGVRPPKPCRIEIETRHRIAAKGELARWLKDFEYEVQIRRKGQLVWWD